MSKKALVVAMLFAGTCSLGAEDFMALPNVYPLSSDATDPGVLWVSAESYDALRSLYSSTPEPSRLHRRDSGPCPPSRGYGAGPDSPISVPDPKSLEQMLAVNDVSLVGRVSRVQAGMIPFPPQIASLVTVKVSEVLKDRENIFAKGAEIYYLLLGGNATFDGIEYCNSGLPGVEIPRAGSEVFVTGGGDPGRPGLVTGFDELFSVQRGEVVVPPEHLFIRGASTLASLRSAASISVP